MPLPTRVVDYFVTLAIAKEEVSVDGRFQHVGLPLECCWRFPEEDFDDSEFPKDIGSFAFPDGAHFRMAAELPTNMQYSFVLTEADGGRIYCSALRFWRQVSLESTNYGIYAALYGSEISEIGETTQSHACYEPIILITVSHWPFFNAFSDILKIMYNLTESQMLAQSPRQGQGQGQRQGQRQNLSYPIERALCNLIYETPLPPRGRTIVKYNCYGHEILFLRPPPNQLLLRSNDLHILLHCLSLENIITLVGAIICEKRILFFANDLSLLTPVIEALCSLIFPFAWRQIYVPVLPSKFTDFIYAPMPFLCGVLPKYMPEIELLEGVIFVDLDADCIRFHSSDPIPAFPRAKLTKYMKQIVSNPKKRFAKNETLSTADEKLIADAFIRFFAKFLRDYKSYMNPSQSQNKEKFNKDKWVSVNCENSEHQLFFEYFVEAQLFQCFIDERFEAQSHRNDHNYNVLYFDEKIDAIVWNKATPFLDDSTFLHNPNKCYVVAPPLALSKAECLLFSSAYAQNGFPLAFYSKYLSMNQFYSKLRAAPVLVTQQDLLTQQPSMHISFATIEFFRQKRLYDRHWHSLAARVSQQNSLFNRVRSFFILWHEIHSKYILNITEMKCLLSTVDVIDTHTSIDEPWKSICSCMLAFISATELEFVSNRRQCFLPIMESVPSQANALRVIIAAARECESQTANTKCKVESDNKTFMKYSKKLQELESQYKASSLSPGSGSGHAQGQGQGQGVHDDTKVNFESSKHNRNHKKKLDEYLSALEQKDKSSIEHIDSSTDFLTNLQIFSATMPILIDEVKTISKERINQLKKQLYHFIHSQRVMYEAFTRNLIAIEEQIEKIDGDNDIEKTFMEGKATKAQTQSGSQTQSESKVSESNEKKADTDTDTDTDTDADAGVRARKSAETANANQNENSMALNPITLDTINRKSFSHLSKESHSQIIGGHRSFTSNLSISNLQKHLRMDENRRQIHQQLINKFEANCVVYKKNADADTDTDTRESESGLQEISINVIDENKEMDTAETKVDAGANTNTNTNAVDVAVDVGVDVNANANEVVNEVSTEMKAVSNIAIRKDSNGIQRVTECLYSDNLWGPRAFEHVVSQCDDGKSVIKCVIRVMEELSDLMDLQAKNLFRCCQMQAKKVVNASDAERLCWKQLLAVTEQKSMTYRVAVEDMRGHIFGLKVVKGELKCAIKLLQKKKSELNIEVQFATKNVQFAYDERNACLRIYRQSQSQWKQLQNRLCSRSASQTGTGTATAMPDKEMSSSQRSHGLPSASASAAAAADPSAEEHSVSKTNESDSSPIEYASAEQIESVISQMTIAQFNFKQADAKWDRSKSTLKGIKQKEDLCNGVILDTFRDKEIARQWKVSNGLASISKILFRLVLNIHTGLHRFVQVCNALDVDQELHNFVDNEIRSSSAMLDNDSIRWTLKSVQLSWKCSKDGIASTKALIDFFQLRVNSSEQYARSIANVNTNTKSKFGYSLNDLLVYFSKFILDLCEVAMNSLTFIRVQMLPLLKELKKALETQQNASHQLISECNADFNKLEERLARSVMDCRKYGTIIDNTKNRIQDKENPNAERKKFQIFSKSKTQLNADLSSAQQKLKQEISNRDRLKSQLQQKSKYRDVLFSKVITDFIRFEDYRLQMFTYICLLYSKMNEEQLDKINDLAAELRANVRVIDVDRNVSKFVNDHQSIVMVPKIVLEHASFQMEQENSGEIENLNQLFGQKRDHILNQFQTGIATEKYLFDHEQQLLLSLSSRAGSTSNQKTKAKHKHKNKNYPLTLLTTKTKTKKLIHVPKLKQRKLNNQIMSHLFSYVQLHSQKGGKHARVTSLHSIMRGVSHSMKHRSRLKNKSMLIKSNSNTNNNSQVTPPITAIEIARSHSPRSVSATVAKFTNDNMIPRPNL